MCPANIGLLLAQSPLAIGATGWVFLTRNATIPMAMVSYRGVGSGSIKQNEFCFSPLLFLFPHYYCLINFGRVSNHSGLDYKLLYGAVRRGNTKTPQIVVKRPGAVGWYFTSSWIHVQRRANAMPRSND